MNPPKRNTFFHVLGIVMQAIGSVLAIAIVGAFMNDGGSTDWSGIGWGIVGIAALIIGGTILTKKK